MAIRNLAGGMGSCEQTTTSSEGIDPLLELLMIDGKLLTRIQHNCDSFSSCERVLLYNHGHFPSSLTSRTRGGSRPLQSTHYPAIIQNPAVPVAHVWPTGAGFPDAGVTPDALHQHASGSQLPENGYFASRFPRKLCEKVMKKMPKTAFVAFNTLGIPGSTQSPPLRSARDETL